MISETLFDPDFESWIRPWLDPRQYALGESGRLPGLENLLDRSVLRGGKRLRPILTAEFGALFGIARETLAPFARAAEHVHSATLAHDDVIDASDRRRGIPTLNARIENRRAVLGGDYLLAEGLRAVARLKEPEVLASLVETLGELVTGELLQNEARGRVDVTRDHLRRVAHMKTASLFRWCCGVSVQLTKARAPVADLTRNFATRVGLAFQGIDDALDFAEGTGKPMGQDLREGLVNSVTCHLLENHPESRKAVIHILRGEPFGSLPWSEAELRKAADGVRHEAEEHLHFARMLLAELIRAIERDGLTPEPGAGERLGILLDQLEGRKK